MSVTMSCFFSIAKNCFMKLCFCLVECSYNRYRGIYVTGCDVKCLKTSDLRYGGSLFMVAPSLWLQLSGVCPNLGNVPVGQVRGPDCEHMNMF